jgi:hypothetical protein
VRAYFGGADFSFAQTKKYRSHASQPWSPHSELCSVDRYPTRCEALAFVSHCKSQLSESIVHAYSLACVGSVRTNSYRSSRSDPWFLPRHTRAGTGVSPGFQLNSSLFFWGGGLLAVNPTRRAFATCARACKPRHAIHARHATCSANAAVNCTYQNGRCKFPQDVKSMGPYCNLHSCGQCGGPKRSKETMCGACAINASVASSEL